MEINAEVDGALNKGEAVKVEGYVTATPAPGRRIVLDLPNGELKYEMGALRLILEEEAPLTFFERAQ